MTEAPIQAKMLATKIALYNSETNIFNQKTVMFNDIDKKRRELNNRREKLHVEIKISFPYVDTEELLTEVQGKNVLGLKKLRSDISIKTADKNEILEVLLNKEENQNADEMPIRNYPILQT